MVIRSRALNVVEIESEVGAEAMWQRGTFVDGGKYSGVISVTGNAVERMISRDRIDPAVAETCGMLDILGVPGSLVIG